MSFFFRFQTVAETLNPKNQVTDSVTGQILGEYHEWIYIYEPQSKQWKKLIPGRCPQWIPNSKAFIYFLDVGYDGNRAELWQAKANGEGRVRITKSDVFISTTPMISPDRKSLAYQLDTGRASGYFRDIVVIELGGQLPETISEHAKAKVVFRASMGDTVESLTWLNTHTLQVTINKKEEMIDITQEVGEHMP